MDNMAFSLPFCLGEAGFDGIVAGRPWVSLLRSGGCGGLGGLVSWQVEANRGSLFRLLLLGCRSFISRLDHCGSGDGGIGDGEYRCSFGLVVGVFISFAS